MMSRIFEFDSLKKKKNRYILLLFKFNCFVYFDDVKAGWIYSIDRFICNIKFCIRY